MATGTQTELSQLNIKQATTDDVVRQMEEQGKLGANEFIVTPRGTAVPMMPVGSIFMSAIPQTDARVHLLDGSTISQTGMYETFANKIKGLSNMWIPIACTQEEFDADVLATGNCGKFVIDDDAGTIRLPKITTFIQGLTDISNIGSSLSAGLPNITGSFAVYTYNDGAPSGAFSSETRNTSQVGGSTSGRNYIGFNLNASKSNAIYGNSETVQPNATQYPYYIVLANGYKSSEVINIDNVASDLNFVKNNTKFVHVNKQITGLTNSSETPTNTVIDLTDVLPADSNNYMLLISVNAWGQGDVGKSPYFYAYSSIITEGLRLVGGRNYSSSSGEQLVGCGIIPIASDRYLSLEVSRVSSGRFIIHGYWRC